MRTDISIWMPNPRTIWLFALLWIALGSRAQYGAHAYERLMSAKKKAVTPQQKLQSALELADFHCEQMLLKRFSSTSMDSAKAYLETAGRLSAATKSKKAEARTAIGYSRLLELQLEYDQAIEYANKAIRILEKQSDKKLLAKAYKALHDSYRYVNPLDKTIILAEKMLAISLESNDDAIIGKAYENLAESQSRTPDFDKTIALLDKARHHYQKGKVTDTRSLHVFYGMMYMTVADYHKTLEANLKAFEIAEKYNIKDFYNMTIYMAMGNLYRDMGKFDKAIKFYEKGFAMLADYDLARHHVLLSRQLASANVKAKNFAEAERYLRISEGLYQTVDAAFKDFVLMALLESYPDIGKPKRADPYAADAVQYLDAQDIKKPTYGSLSFALAKYYFANMRYDEAKVRAQNSVDFLSQTPARYKIYEPYKLLYRIDSINGDYESAIKNSHLANICKDSVTNIANRFQVAELEIKHDIAKKNTDNLMLRKQGELQKAALSKTQTAKNISLVALVLLVVIVFLIYRKFRITQRLRMLLAAKNEELEEILEEKDVLITEKEWLLKEIHHRVKNNLQIVMSLLNSQSYFLDDDVAKQAIENSQHRIHSMSLIHKKLYQSDTIATINMAAYFWELMEYYKVAFDTEGRILFQLDVDSVELQASQAVPIGLILNETVNNALKHAFPDNRHGVIKISLKTLDEHKVLLAIADNGIGYSGSLSDVSTSLGMKLIHGFSKDLSGDLQFRDDNGFEVTITFAIIKTILDRDRFTGQISA